VGPIGCPETSDRNYHQSLRGSPEGRGSLLLTYVSVLDLMFLKIYIFLSSMHLITKPTLHQSPTYIFNNLHKGYKQFQINFYVLLTCISMHLCNKDQPDALHILSLFRQSTSTCFGHICSPSSGSVLYIYNSLYVLCTTRTNCCINRVYVLMMGYKYVRNM
jgi:hypothetical protein